MTTVNVRADEGVEEGIQFLPLVSGRARRPILSNRRSKASHSVDADGAAGCDKARRGKAARMVGFRIRRVGRTGQAVFAAVILGGFALYVAVQSPLFWRLTLYRVDVLAPGAGFEFVMPRDGLDAIALVRENKLQHFRFGPGLSKQSFLRQRIGEGSFPALPSPRSPDLIDSRSSIEAAGCPVLATNGKMAYARCSR